MQEFRTAIGANIRHLRLHGKNPCTQFELAIQAGERPESISRIERGKVDFGISHLLKIANALEVDPMTLLDFHFLAHTASEPPHATYADPPIGSAPHIHHPHNRYADEASQADNE